MCHALGETVRKQRVQRRVRQGQGALRRDCATALGLLTEGEGHDKGSLHMGGRGRVL